MDLWDQSTTADDAGKPAAMAQLTSEPTGENKPVPSAAPAPPEQKPEAPQKGAAPTAPAQASQPNSFVTQVESARAKQVSDIGLLSVSPQQYDSIMQAAKSSPDPQGTIAKTAQAMKYEQLTGIPADKAVDILPALNKAFVGDPMPSQENFGNTVSKALDNGSYFMQAGRIGGLLANDPHNPELRQAAEYVNKKLEETAPYAQKNIFTQTLQMAPFLIDGLATSALGGVGGIASMVTAGVNVAQMSATMRGADFLRIQRDTQAALVKKGVDPEEAYQKATDVAGPISQTSGIIEGSLGELLGGFPALRGLMGKEAAPITSKIIDAIMQDGVTSRVGQKLALQGGLHYAASALESGANMAAFELTQRLSDKTAAVLSDSGVPQPTAAAIAKDVGGAFGNGILIGLITGVPALAKAEIGAVRAGSAEAATRVTEAKNLATMAKTLDQDGFKSAADRLDLVSFKGMEAKDKAAALDQIWKTSHASEAPETTAKPGEAPEGKTTTSTTGEAPEPTTGSTAPLARDEGGKLYANDEPEVLRRDGSSMIMEDRIGDPTSQKAYSLHQFTVDDEAKTVTVDSMKFKTGVGDAEREEMARQYVDRLQQRYPGFDIKWEPDSPKMQAIRDKIVADNPQGLEKGLNYYQEKPAPNSTKVSELQAAVKQLHEEIAHNKLVSPNSVPVLEGELAKYQGALDKEQGRAPFKADEFRKKAQAAFGLKDNEADAALSLVHAFAKGEGTDAETWLGTHLDPRMIANAGEKQIAQGNKAGTSFTDSEGKPIAPEKVSQVQGHAKALIVATKKGDFSSIAHELFHVAQLTTKDEGIRKAISDYFGIDYDKLGRDAMEHMADHFERYLTSGRADAQLKGAFGKIADIMARYVSEFVRRLKGNPKLEAIFDKMLGSDTPFGEALRKADDQLKGREVKKVEPGSMEDKYNKIKDTQGGRVLDVDIARELVPGYKPEEAGKVHEEASAIIKQRYTELLQEPVEKGKEPFVLFTAGGSGSGKTTAIRTTLDGLRGKADIVYEGMMSKVESSVKKIDQALESGRDVHIAYVHRDPVDAWHSVLDRAEETGRTVPLDAHAEAHSSVQTTIEKLQDIYKDTPQVVFHAIDNNQGPGKAREVPFETLPKIETQSLKEQLHEGLAERYRAGSISEKTYRGSVPAISNEPGAPEGNIGATREGTGRQPEPQRPEVSQVEKPIRAVPARDIPVKDIHLSEDVPNFKEGANSKGVVSPLKSDTYQRLGTAAIVARERLNGTLEIITGRHRLELAQRLGEETIPTQVVKESEGWDDKRSRAFDAESNIMSEKGTVRDYSNYFKNSDITLEQAQKQGLLSREKGIAGFAIGKYAGDDLYSLYRNKGITDEKAATIAEAAPNDPGLQAVGMKAAKDMKADELFNYMQAVKQMQGGAGAAEQLDMFGRDDSAVREAEKIAKEATTVQHELSNELGALNGALKLSKGDRAKILEQYGFKAGDEAAIRARVQELEGKVQAWDNWSTDPAKYQELRRRAGLPFKQDVIDAASQTAAETGRPEEPMLFQHDDDLEEARQYKSPEEWMKATGAKDEDADFYKKTWEEATQKPLVSKAQARVDFAEEVKADNHALGHDLLKAIGENLLKGKIQEAHTKGGRELSVIDAYALDEVSGRQITEAKWKVIDAWIEKNPDKYRELASKLLGRDDIARQMGAEGDGTAPREPVRIKGSNSDQDAQVAGAALQRLVDKLGPEAADKLSSEKWTKASAQAYAESTRMDISRLQAKVDKSQAEVQQLKDLMKAQRAGQLASEQRTAYEKTVRRNPGPTIDYAHAQIVRAVMDFLDPIDQGKRVMTDEKNAVFAKYDELAKQFLTPEQIDKIKTAPLNEWSTKDLKDLAGSLRELRQAGRDEYFAKASERKARLDDQAMEVRQTLVANHPADGRAPVGSKEYQHANGGKLGRTLRSFDLPQTNILREARTIDGKEDGPVLRIVMKEVEADRASDTMSRARKAALAEALKGQDLDTRHFYDKKGDVQIMGKTFNRATLMSLYVGMQDSFSRGHIVYGNFMSHVDREAMAGHPELEEAGDRITSAIRQATDTLTAKEKAVADAYLANMNEHRGRFFNAEVELDNKSPENVQAYFPCYLNEPEDPRGFKADIMGLFGLKKQTNKGATINRIDIAPENQKSINLDFFSVYEKAIESQERFIAMAPFLRDWNAVFGSSNRSTIVREEIGNRLGAEHVQYLDDWAGCVANPKAWDRIQDMEKGISTAARLFRGGLTTAYLGFRSAMGVQHIATYWMPYIPHAGGELLHQMLVHLNPVTALKDWAWIKEQSAVVRNIEPGIAVHDLAKMDFGNAAMNKIRDLSMLFERGSQNYAVLNGWKAMYDKTIAAGQADLGSGKITGDQLHIQAVNKADEITLKVQPTWQPEYIAPALRSKNGMMKIITQFMEPMNVVYNQLRHDVPDSIADGHLMKAAGIVTSLMAVGAIYGLIRAPQEDDDDATQKMKDVFAGIAKEGIDSILFVGPILDGLVDSAITGHTLFQQKTEAFPAADQMINALQKIESGNGGGVALMEAFAVALGLPVSAVKDYYRAFGGDLGALIGRPAKK